MHSKETKRGRRKARRREERRGEERRGESNEFSDRTCGVTVTRPTSDPATVNGKERNSHSSTIFTIAGKGWFESEGGGEVEK